MMNLYPRVRPSKRNPRREFQNGCRNVSGEFGHSCIKVDSGNCSETTTAAHCNPRKALLRYTQGSPERPTLLRRCADPTTCDNEASSDTDKAFADNFQQLYNRCKKCIVVNGNYFECQ
ncbi:hypothetical protein AVEN_112761-1 [Araneus ventricosus]|uniref:Uncharacterized protein n=1 Tax=Araneus ventricosus TaxID=182803 RepID=A0A4Y2KAF1_ARAVE|nr:hypothetical protein AVEN_112761-1 [Araneus ventricosus]